MDFAGNSVAVPGFDAQKVKQKGRGHASRPLPTQSSPMVQAGDCAECHLYAIGHRGLAYE